MSELSPALRVFHPTLAGWFAQTFGQPTDIQLDAWASILEHRHTLIAAPTGSGKTLAALLPCLNRIAEEKIAAQATGKSRKPGVRVLYITPLKALNNDIQYHIIGFMEAIERFHDENLAQETYPWPGVRSAVRTGDTSASERAKMVRNPPDVLVTTPESCYLLLTSEKGRGMLKTVETVIVDEIHGLAGDKRGAHLSLSLERLSSLCPQPVLRIGVSATQKPLERVARFLGGWESPSAVSSAAPAAETDSGPSGSGQPPHPLGHVQRAVRIVESLMSKSIEVRVTMPDLSRPAKTRDAAWLPLVDRVFQLMGDARSVLVFVNSRRMCERLVLRLNEHAGYEMARAHHGSLARERRLSIEQMLKAGELRCLVATSSLELGIDVGHVELVIQIDSPKQAAAGIQRIGRAGHAVGDVSRGFILARGRSELPESAVLCRDISRRDIEEIVLPHEPLDVLSQQITAMVAAEDLEVRQLHALISQSECYREFPLARLEASLKVLAGFYPFAKPIMDWDRSLNLLQKRANTAMAAITGAGTIPQSSAYPVHHADSRVHLGELDEEYIHESRVGDVFQLGTSSWVISSIQNDRVYVKEAPNRFSEIPFWRAESGGRGYELGVKLGQFFSQLENRLNWNKEDVHEQSSVPVPDVSGTGEEALPPLNELETAAIDWLDTEYGLDAVSAGELIGFAKSQHLALALPTDGRIVIEHYRDLMNQTRVIIHNPFGRRINRTWLLAIEHRFKQLLPYKMYGNAKDNGIELVLPEWDASWLQTLWQITPESIEPLMTEAITGSPLLAIAFRRIAETSLLLSRSFTRTPMWQKRLRSEELLKQSLPYAEHFPYLQEAMRECLHLYLDVNGLKRLLAGISAGQIDIVVQETNTPSPFAVQFLWEYINTQIYEGDGLSEATQLQLMSVSKSLAGELFGEEAVRRAIDPLIADHEAKRLEAGELIPSSPSELYTLLKWRGDLTFEEAAAITQDAEHTSDWLDSLRQTGSVTTMTFGSELRYICADETGMYESFPGTDSGIAFVAGRFAEHRLSFTEEELRGRYPALSASDAGQVVLALIRLDLIEQAPFAASSEERIWTSRRVAKRLIRLTMEQARKQAEPVDPIRWCAHMSMLQHALPGTQLTGIDGLRTIIGLLQGFYLPASHWESVIFPARMTGYRKEDLDLLCATGEVLWLGRKEEQEKEGKIAFFLADAKPLYAPYVKQAPVEQSGNPKLLALLQENGASFLTKLSRDYGKPPSELLADLIALVWEGRVSNDQFAPLRLQLLTKGKQHAKTGSGLGRWYWTGSLKDHEDAEDVRERPAPAINGSAAEAETEPVLYWTQHLLDSCGIVSKELVTQLSPFSWDELLPVLRQLEHWGVVTRGLLVQGVPTLQFARREQIAAVREPMPGRMDDALTVLSAADPANPFGLAADWPSAYGANFSRKNGNYLVLHNGIWRYWMENNGRRIVELDTPSASGTDHAAPKAGIEVPQKHDLLRQVFRTVLNQQGLSKIRIDRWNGEDIADSGMAAELRSLGAERDNRSLVLWASDIH
ncbi:DEAD/DEAH box helicase [Paenibacillus nasutitermitis]|uniref:ATP-dependent DNA helicase n=1 Tax=Paenibacillus nasutitermitis TaxID=1652958 RepID=A0A916ZGA0_9BACL|nr:DEAD/DEAH box helicase [Paenibacillus nasutitermitis]GGD95957.1 ATP-dependent DNA helicase [Paenibacillus nasutitermitis]